MTNLHGKLADVPTSDFKRSQVQDMFHVIHTALFDTRQCWSWNVVKSRIKVDYIRYIPVSPQSHACRSFSSDAVVEQELVDEDIRVKGVVLQVDTMA